MASNIKRFSVKNSSGTARAVEQPSLATIAERAGVSVSTVSRVLNGHDERFGKETVERVRRLISEFGYRPHRSGRALRTRQSSIVAALTSDPSNAYFAAIAQSIESALRADDHVMILSNTMGDPTRQDESLMEMRSYLVRGMILFGAVPSEGLQRFLDENEPLVFIIRPCPLDVEAPLVGVDNLQAGQDVAAYFLARAFDPCAAICGVRGSRASEMRLMGFREGMANGGRVVATTEEGIDYPLLESGYRQAAVLLDRKPRPKAIFCMTDMLAYGAFRRCYELGLRVPDDVVLFGFDDNPLNEWVAPWLSTVRTPYDQFGPAVRTVFERLWSGESRDPPRITLPYELVIRPG